MNDRPKCKCGKTTAINYRKNGKIYYRKSCHKCIANKKKTDWQKQGYIKKIICEKCGLNSKYAEQIKVIRTKGINPVFKSVCLNCDVLISKDGWVDNSLGF